MAYELGQTATEQEGFFVDDLISAINDLTIAAREKITDIKERGDAISIADMFDMQMQMNHLSQMSEASTSVVNACNAAIMSTARQVKA